MSRLSVGVKWIQVFVCLLMIHRVYDGAARAQVTQDSHRDEVPRFAFDLTVVDPGTSNPVPLSAYSGNNCYFAILHLDTASSRAQIRVAERLHSTFQDEFLKVVGIVFQHRSKKRLSLYLTNRPVLFPIFNAEPWHQLALGNIQVFPTNFLVDTNGHIVERFEGYRSFEHMKSVIETTFQSSIIQPTDRNLCGPSEENL
jgi:hypothetical protein